MKLQCVVTNRNASELVQYVELAGRMGVEAIGFLILKELNPYVDYYHMNASEWEDIRGNCRLALAKARDLGIHIDANPQLFGECPNRVTTSLPEEAGALKSSHLTMPYRCLPVVSDKLINRRHPQLKGE